MALGKIGSEKAVAKLLEALQDKSYEVRGHAAVALGKIGPEKAVEKLCDALKDKSESVRSSAAVALGKIGSEKAVAKLLEALQDKSESVSVRSSAAEALGNIGSGSEKAVAKLLEVLQDESCVDVSVPKSITSLKLLLGVSTTVTLDKKSSIFSCEILIYKLIDEDIYLQVDKIGIHAGYKNSPEKITIKRGSKPYQALLNNFQAFAKSKELPTVVYDHLLDDKPMINMPTYLSKENNLIKLIHRGNLEEIKKSVAGIDINRHQKISGEKYRNAIDEALYIFSYEIKKYASFEKQIKELPSSRQLYKNQTDNDFNPKLYDLIKKDSRKSIWQLLSDSVTDVSAKNKITIFLKKSSLNTQDKKDLRDLLRNYSKLDLNEQTDSKRYTPLMYAMIMGCSCTFDELLRLGVTLTQKNLDGKTALQMCAEKNKQYDSKKIFEIIKYLIANRKTSLTLLESLTNKCYLSFSPKSLSEAIGHLLGASNVHNSYYLNKTVRKDYQLFLENTISVEREGEGILRPNGLTVPQFIVMRIRHYFELLLRLERGNIDRSDLPYSDDGKAPFSFQAVHDKLQQEILVLAELFWSHKLRLSYYGLDKRQRSQLRDAHLANILTRLQMLKPGEEYLLQTGYQYQNILTSGEHGHCIYVALMKQQAGKILIRVDNRYVKSSRLDGRKHLPEKIKDKYYMRPYCVGELDIKDIRLKNYINGIIEILHYTNYMSGGQITLLDGSATFDTPDVIAMKAIYGAILPKPKDIVNIVKAWPVQIQQDTSHNCTMSSQNYGIMIRQGRKFFNWLQARELSMLKQSNRLVGGSIKVSIKEQYGLYLGSSKSTNLNTLLYSSHKQSKKILKLDNSKHQNKFKLLKCKRSSNPSC